MQLNGKTILLTGASTGIGAALITQLAKEKCRLALLARRKNLIDETVASLDNNNAEIFTLQCDVSSKENVIESFNKIKEIFGDIDIAILNAGVGFRASVKDFDSERAETTFGVNVLGLIYCVEQLLPSMMKKKEGIIAGVSSLADNRGYAGSGFYCASKAAATTFLESLRVELEEYNVKVITVKPGFVKTPMTDKNEFKMPLLMNADTAAMIIVNKIKKEKKIIQFPIPTVLGSKFVGSLPVCLYDYLSSQQKKSK